MGTDSSSITEAKINDGRIFSKLPTTFSVDRPEVSSKYFLFSSSRTGWFW